MYEAKSQVAATVGVEAAPASLSACGGPGPAAAPRQPSILLLDDDTFMLGVQARMLLSMGYSKVRIAASAKAAMALLQTDRVAVDIVICDLNMPDIDGIEFLKLLSASEFRCSVVLLSGQGVRLMNTVQKVLGRNGPQILGALEKPAGRGTLRALLECWTPIEAEPPAAPELTFSADELQVAVETQAWELHYQPKVNVQTGAVDGMEALVRWRHPMHGLVYPKLFIGLAEECGAIEAITRWVLREALDEFARWQRLGLHIGMAVNVSAQNLHAPNFAYALGTMVRSSSAAPSDLTLELTESRLLAPSTAALENLARLRMHGFKLAIDDFGTGHSSLAQLRDVPFTELKVDRGFVRGACHNQIVRPILEGSIAIARRLGMQSVAEGVEAEDDWYLLREVECDFAQGYFVGEPMLPAAVPEWMEVWRARLPELTA